MTGKTKVRMLVSLAGTVGGDPNFAAQPQQIVSVDKDTAEKWARSGLATAVPQDTPLSESDIFDEISAEEARRRVCSNCEKRRGRYALRGKALCPVCFRAHMALGE